MAQIRCAFCHRYVDKSAYPAHAAKHLKIRADGQQTDYATLPENEREAGDLTGVPVNYRHTKCGTGTRMPDDIVRSYLKNPYLYGDDTTYCCGCGKHVPQRECVWIETGEDLQTYTDRLRAERPGMRPKKPWLMTAIYLALAAAATLFALLKH